MWRAGQRVWHATDQKDADKACLFSRIIIPKPTYKETIYIFITVYFAIEIIVCLTKSTFFSDFSKILSATIPKRRKMYKRLPTKGYESVCFSLNWTFFQFFQYKYRTQYFVIKEDVHLPIFLWKHFIKYWMHVSFWKNLKKCS